MVTAPKKLVLLKPYLMAKTNGGEISMIERLQTLQSWGIEIQIKIAVHSSTREGSIRLLEEMRTPLSRDGHSYELDGLKCDVEFSDRFHPEDLRAQPSMEQYFCGILEREQPFMAITHYTDFFAVTSAVRWDPTRAYVVLTDDEYPRQDLLSQFPTVAQAYPKVKNVVVASRFMRKSAQASLPGSRVLRVPNPVISIDIERIERTPLEWVFVNPTKVKGVDFVLELACTLPDEKFLFVGNWTNEIPEDLPPNVRSIPRQRDIRAVFRKAKALLMPSVWQEAFGRLALEAMGCGVPVIASDRGSLPETVGEGGLSLPLDLKLWVDQMRQPDRLELNVAAGFRRIEAYRRDTQKRLKALRRLLLSS